MSNANQNSNNTDTVIALVAFVFIWSVFLGGALYLITRPFLDVTKRHYKSVNFWIVVLTVLIAILSLIYWFDLYYLNLADVSSMAKNMVFDLLSNYTSLSDRLLVKLTKYIVYTTPLSLFVAFVVIPFILRNKGMDKVTTKEKKRDQKIPARQFKKSREKAHDLLIGINKQKKPVYLTEKEMGMHTQVIGSTGFGKSASVLLPQLDWALKNGTGMVFIDGKGDLDSYSQFLSVVRKHGRTDDLLVFSPVHTGISDKWNPLVRGTPVEIKDRLIGSQIWSEEFYKKKGEDLMLLLLNVFEDLDICPSLKKLERVMVDPNNDLIDVRNISDPDTKNRFLRFKENYKKDSKNFEGIASDLSLFINTHFGKLFECEKGEGIDFLEAYFKNKIIYCHLPVLVSEESIKRIGRMLIHDLKTMVGYVQNFVPEWKRNFFPVFIDEFASFASENFIELLNKARSSKVAFTIIHQSMGDIEKVSVNFSKQLFENTNIKIVLT